MKISNRMSRKAVVVLALFGGALGTSCGEEDACPIGEHLDTELGRCFFSIAKSCPPGTMARLGESECMPVGPSSCEEGFLRATDGWGCRAVMPKEACTGATMARLGRGDCVPLGPCDGAFPPEGTTHLVTESGRSRGGIQGYASINSALADAPDGSLIAVDEGIWMESVWINRSVSLVGRCAARTVVTSLYEPGYTVLLVDGGARATVSGIALTAAAHGPIVSDGSSLTLVRSLIEDVHAFGLVVHGAGSHATLSDTSIRRVSKTNPDNGWGLAVLDGGDLTMRRSELTLANTAGLGVMAQSTARVEQSIIHDTRGRGAAAQEAGLLMIFGSAIVNNDSGGVFAAESGTRLSLVGSLISANRGGAAGNSAGVGVQEDAAMLIRGSTVRANEVLGVYASAPVDIETTVVVDGRALGEQTGRGVEIATGGAASIRDSAIVDNRFIGIALSSDGGSSLRLTRSLVSGTLRGADGSFGYGIIGRGDIMIESSTIEGNHGVGLYSLGGHVRAESLMVRETKFAVGGPGIGVVATGGARIDLAHSGVVANEELGLGFEGGTSGLITQSFVEDHPVGIHPGEGVVLIESPSSREPARGEVILDTETIFRRNSLDQGRGSLILPDLPIDL